MQSTRRDCCARRVSKHREAGSHLRAIRDSTTPCRSARGRSKSRSESWNVLGLSSPYPLGLIASGNKQDRASGDRSISSSDQQLQIPASCHLKLSTHTSDLFWELPSHNATKRTYWQFIHSRKDCPLPTTEAPRVFILARKGIRSRKRIRIRAAFS